VDRDGVFAPALNCWYHDAGAKNAGIAGIKVSGRVLRFRDSPFDPGASRRVLRGSHAELQRVKS
jgi:hypothetical protein